MSLTLSPMSSMPAEEKISTIGPLRASADLQLDEPAVQTPLVEEAAELLAGRILLRDVLRFDRRPVVVGDHVRHLLLRRFRREEDVEEPVFRQFRGLGPDAAPAPPI